MIYNTLEILNDWAVVAAEKVSDDLGGWWKYNVWAPTYKWIFRNRGGHNRL